MTEQSFAEFVREALEGLAREVPRAHAGMVAALAGREVELHVDGERLAICFDPRRPGGPIYAEPRASVVALETSAGTILELARGRASMLEAILDDRLAIRGAIPDLLAFNDALHAYLCGAVRAPSSPARLARFREFAGARAQELWHGTQ